MTNVCFTPKVDINPRNLHVRFVPKTDSRRCTSYGLASRSEDRDRIFDRFWRGKGSKAEGAGLGLAIVKETMKAHGGDVTVSDNADGGALFTLLFASSEHARELQHAM